MAEKSFTSVHDLVPDDYRGLFARAAEIKGLLLQDPALIDPVLRGAMGGLMFYEPSTRTSGSFEKAIKFLGGHVYNFNIAGSSVAKGERVTDTARMVAAGTRFLVVRHPEAGISTKLSSLLDIPVINAGEGTGEHPTQALLDMFTIQERFGTTAVRIGLLGDLRHGRTCHSLIALGARLGASFVCAAPTEDLQMPQSCIDDAVKTGAGVTRVSDITPELAGLDVLYVTRLQRERLPDELHHRFNQGVSGYGVTPETLVDFNPQGIVMHPLPRLDELSEACDTDPRAWYFRQAENGIYARMAVIEHLLFGGGPS